LKLKLSTSHDNLLIGEFMKAARLTPKVCGHDSKRWEDWIFAFADKRQLQVAMLLYMTIRQLIDLRLLFLMFRPTHQD